VTAGYDCFQHLQSRQNAKHAVKFAATRLAIDVRPDEDGRKIGLLAFEPKEKISGNISERRQSNGAGPSDEFCAGGDFFFRQRLSINAAVGQRAETRKFHVPLPEPVTVDVVRYPI
jgi:hypothetical protein